MTSIMQETRVNGGSCSLLVWLSSNTSVLINIVTLHQARLVPGWVTVLGQVNHLGTEPGIHVYSA